MNYPDRKLIKELCAYVLTTIKNRGFGLAISMKDQFVETIRQLRDTISEHRWLRK
jgi:hypothetical protein